MGNAKFAIEKFDGKNDFSLWRVKMRALLVQQGIQDAILGDEDQRQDKVLREVSKETIVAGLWKKLESLYMTKSLKNCLFLKLKLYSFKMQLGKSIEDHMDNFNKISLYLENCDIKIESEYQAIIVLNSLPTDRYEHFVDPVMFGRDSLTLEEVHNALMSKELKRKSEKEDNSGEGLLIARGRIEGRYNRNQHQAHSTKGKPNSNDDGYESAGVLVASIGYSGLYWVIDSGCSFHVEGGVLKVTQGAKVITKGSVINGVYVLQGSTAKNLIYVASKEMVNSFVLWHKRLGRVSLKGLEILIKKGLLGKKVVKDLHFYEHRVLGKSTKLKFGTGLHCSKDTLDYVHLDLWGPFRVTSTGGARCPSSAIVFKTPVEARTGHPVDYEKLRTFGCIAYAHIKQDKLEPRARKCLSWISCEGL
ncbi:uncharacterized protein LOC133039124 [Cannabis sativa]|uniref:uncharacterized protein LOC133039124 n=1 Tax=Cannabis sativa TaxID=3483 RepID=UPI0029CA2AA8|nr:uncharacterized protein LOC133039124 [Cannabis sativa]